MNRIMVVELMLLSRNQTDWSANVERHLIWSRIGMEISFYWHKLIVGVCMMYVTPEHWIHLLLLYLPQCCRISWWRTSRGSSGQLLRPSFLQSVLVSSKLNGNKNTINFTTLFCTRLDAIWDADFRRLYLPEHCSLRLAWRIVEFLADV